MSLGKDIVKKYKEYSKRFAARAFAPYLDDEEEIITKFHRHPFIILKDMAKVFFVGLLIPVFLYLLFPEFAAFFVMWIAIGVIRMLYVFVDWYHDVILVTNGALVEVYWEGFFTRTSTRLEFAMIEAVSTEIKGPIQTLFNYGKIIIKSMGGTGTFELKDAINPRKVEKSILAYQAEFMKEEQFKDAGALKELITNMLRSHIKVTQDKVTFKK